MPPELTARSVVAAAADYADTHSVETLSLFAIARELGVDAAEVERVVPTRDALLSGVQTLALAELGDRVEAALADGAGDGRVRAIAESFRGYSRERHGRWRSLLRPLSEQAAADPDSRRILRIMLDAMSACGVPHADRVHASRMTSALVVGFIRLEAAGIFDLRSPDAEDTWHRMIAVCEMFLREWPAPEPEPR